ncbi:hypothetical protein ACDI59_27890, partial [Klebsiella pneumoniae]|uniref:hypothetical protein n=1 Tax=Klebsiella pneumoniae TaxID=573 RepID=UPI00353244E3
CLSFIHFALGTSFSPLSENPKIASPTKVGPTDLYYLFIKLLFEEYENGFASGKVRPICRFTLLITPLRKTDFGLRNPPRRSSFFVFRPSTLQGLAENDLRGAKSAEEKLEHDFPAT